MNDDYRKMNTYQTSDRPPVEIDVELARFMMVKGAKAAMNFRFGIEPHIPTGTTEEEALKIFYDYIRNNVPSAIEDYKAKQAEAHDHDG